MQLFNLHFPGEAAPKDCRIEKGRILEIRPSAILPANTPAPGPEPGLQFSQALAFPGLINSHDHLDFNLFPMLGHRIYKSYTEWGPDIHRRSSAVIKAVLQVPQELRTLWGVYKNLLNGFTTVVNHGAKLSVDNTLINVFQHCHCLHSPAFERRWRWKLNRFGISRRPFVLHVGEGVDPAAVREIDRLIRWNLFNRPLVGIHGVAMNERQAAAFRALVWCPASNYFLLDKTAPVDLLKARVPILFGTDSTLTSGWNHWAQLRMARRLGLMTDPELLETMTTAAAKAWQLEDIGTLAEGKIADIVIARPKPDRTETDRKGMEDFYALDPEDFLLVMRQGEIRLFDATLLEPLTALGIPTRDFHQLGPGGKYVYGDLPGLMQTIRQYYPDVNFPSMP